MKTEKISLVLAGTGSFSKSIFEALLKDDRFIIKALISQPNNKLDRNKKPIETEVAKLAKENNILLYQPNKIKEIYEELSNLDFDFFITASFGQFIPNSILKLPKVMPLNVHGSLLEKYRGAAPIQYALLNDDKKTGITLIEMIDKMDAGNMYGKAEVEILETDTALELFDKLAKATIENLGNWISEIKENKATYQIQDESKVTLAPKISNEEAELFLEMNAQEALNKIRAFNDQPGAYIMLNNKRLKIYRATKNKVAVPLNIKFKDQKLYLLEYQFEGKKKVSHEF
ncbi:methionyl-tRNA formyltransferase [Mycoplasma struthionis]|uniref:methionyl-tRNA formyltransferase n=1 Tax=Mycoplasma struthionis TaxID=538220 RepID=A0A502M2Q8_9MOLU|nr:methionyl-tRNA formyltransferase [Mycoplasma struthionis]TPI02528.1 methionyl-tRNA formyltransferase [Mycoplasma struthionis]